MRWPAAVFGIVRRRWRYAPVQFYPPNLQFDIGTLPDLGIAKPFAYAIAKAVARPADGFSIMPRDSRFSFAASNLLSTQSIELPPGERASVVQSDHSRSEDAYGKNVRPISHESQR